MSKIFTSSDLQAYMNSPANWSDAVGQQVTDSVNQWIETYTRRCFGEIKTVTERYDWSPAIYLRHIDIVEPPDDLTQPTTMSIILGYPHILQSSLDATSYFYDVWGRVTMYLQNPTEFNVSAVNNDLVEITYNYGYHQLGYSDAPTNSIPIVPDDLVLAALGIAAGFYDWATSNQKDIVSASVGTYRLQYAGAVRGVPDPNGGADPDTAYSHDKQNWLILDSYKFKRL